ncbi:MAG: bL21 family ribosomal protein, partial [Dehalococcoidia bacterium]
GKKIYVFKYKSKTRQGKKTGHRQSYTRVRITDIVTGAAPPRARRRRRTTEATPPETTTEEPKAEESSDGS